MATKIRLKRGGRKGQAYYRIVVQDSRVRPRGRELDVLGYYHPAARPEPLSEVDMHKSLDWLSKGAEMSDTARDILSRTGVLKHYNDGTRPEEPSAVVRGGIVENKGYNPPPPPSEKEEAPAPEEAKAAEVEAAASEPDSAEAPEAAAEEAVPEKQAPVTETSDAAADDEGEAAPETEES